MTQQKSVIIASAHLLDGPLKLGSAHLARCFAEAGYRTLYLNAPTSLLHWANPGSRAAAAQRMSALGGKQTPIANLSQLTPLTFLPHHNSPALSSRFALDNWPAFTMPRIAAQLSRAGFDKADAVIFDSVMFWPLVKKLGLASVYRVADNVSGFAVNTRAMIDLHAEAIRDADFVFYTSNDLAHDARLRSRPSRIIPNGVYASLFEAPQSKPPEYRALKAPIVVYAGAIESWFDTNGFRIASERFPDVNFVVIGPNSDRLWSDTARPNVHVLGSRPHALLPAYLQHAHVGIIPFDLAKNGAMLDGVCPLKLFEYLACGLTVVSFGGKGVLALDAPAHLYDPRPGALCPSATFSDALAAALRQLPVPEATREARRGFARDADWTSRFAEIVEGMRAAGIKI